MQSTKLQKRLRQHNKREEKQGNIRRISLKKIVTSPHNLKLSQWNLQEKLSLYSSPEVEFLKPAATNGKDVIENHDQYPKKMCFDIFGADKIEQFNIQMGEELTVSFDIDARPMAGSLVQQYPRMESRTRRRRRTHGSGSSVPPPAPSSAPEFIAGDAKDDLPF